MYDLIIRNGSIVDGTGNPRYNADIALKNGLIEEIGDIYEPAKKEISVDGNIVSPGFIDMHSHADLFLLKNPNDNHRILQGVTTEIVGNCGFSAAPTNGNTVEDYKGYAQPIMGVWSNNIAHTSTKAYLEALQNTSLRHNVGALVGLGALRVAVVGFTTGLLSTIQMNKLLKLLKLSLNEGALGLSMGLMYVPEAYFTTSELIQIAQVLAEHKKIITVHIRGEGTMLLESIDEMIEIAEKSGASIHISHIKAAGKKQWGTALHETIKKIEAARKRGLEITADAYPYTAGSTTLLSLLPPWVQANGVAVLDKQLQDSVFSQKVAKAMKEQPKDWDNIALSVGWDRIIISGVPNEKHNHLVGKNIAECANDANLEPVNFVLKLICNTAGAVSIIIHQMDSRDVERAIACPFINVISDSIYSDTGRPHPRMYGSFACLLGNFVRERSILTLEEAIKKCTSMPADRMKLSQRGRIKEGAVADIVIFDADNIADSATYLAPRQYPKGISGVIIAGKLTLWQGEIISGAYGKVLR